MLIFHMVHHSQFYRCHLTVDGYVNHIVVFFFSPGFPCVKQDLQRFWVQVKLSLSSLWSRLLLTQILTRTLYGCKNFSRRHVLRNKHSSLPVFVKRTLPSLGSLSITENANRSTLPFRLQRSVVNNDGNISNLLFTRYVDVDLFAASWSIAVPAST